MILRYLGIIALFAILSRALELTVYGQFQRCWMIGLAGGLAIMADRNAAAIAWTVAGGANGEFVTLDNSKKTENSANHGSDRDGQNVLFLGTSVQWTQTTRVGVDNDNIWTASTDPDLDGDNLTGYNYPRTVEDRLLAL